MQKIVIANVLYTASDETFYVLNSQPEHAEKYVGDTLQETIANLEADNWHTCGKVIRPDEVPVDMMSDGQLHYIALWTE